jgi:hypothetical protein
LSTEESAASPLVLPEGTDPAGIQAALKTLRDGRDRFPASAKVRVLLASVLITLGLLDEAEAELRTAVGLSDANHETSRQLALVLRRMGRLQEAFQTMATAPQSPATGGSNILIACMPKSGSSWLRTMINSFDFIDTEYLAPLHDRREQELDFLILNRERPNFFVAQHHVRANGSTDYAVENFNIATVVLLRNLFDNLVSARDHFADRRPISPQFYMDGRFKTWDRERQMLFLADFYAPWIVNFIATWWHSKINTFWLTYDILKDDTETAVRCVLDHAGFNVSSDGLRAAVHSANEEQKTKTLFNVGTSGRGETVSAEVRAKVRTLCAYYPEIPFDRMGLL